MITRVRGAVANRGFLSQNMPELTMKLKLNWYWGLIGLLGILGFILNEPLYYVFFVFFLFFLQPVARKKK